MKKVLAIIVIILTGSTAIAQHSVTLTSGRTINGKILKITNEYIVIQEDTTKYECPLPQVESYYDGSVVKPITGIVSKQYNEMNSSAGDELIQTTKIYYAGFAVSTVGLATALIVPQFYKYDDDDTEEIKQWKDETRATIAIIGGGIAIVGYIVQVTAFTHLKLAGNKLNATVNQNGLGLSMTF